ARVWQSATVPYPPPFQWHKGPVSSVAWSPDGKRLVTGSFDKTAKVWDADKGQELLFLKGHTGAVTSVAWSPDGKRLATGASTRRRRCGRRARARNSFPSRGPETS